MSTLEFAIVVLAMDLIAIVVMPFREALTQSFNNPRSAEEIGKAVTSSKVFQRWIGFKLGLSATAIAVYAWSAGIGIALAILGFLAFSAVLFSLVWRD